MSGNTDVIWLSADPARVRPTRKELQDVLEDYVRDIGTVQWNRDRFCVELPGRNSFPFMRSGPPVTEDLLTIRQARAHDADGRGFEVWPTPETREWTLAGHRVCLITRHADEITHAIVDGFAQVLKRGWGARIEAG